MSDPRDVQFVDLVQVLQMSHQEYLEQFRGTAVRRAKHWMLQRNAAVALGNSGRAEAIAPLLTALRSDVHPQVRGHAAWALGQIAIRLGRRDLREALVSARQHETDSYVSEEIALAIADVDARKTETD